MEKELEGLGLTRNEIAIYVFLLRGGSTTTGSIIRETGISNSRVYESLNSLIKKGLVIYTIQKNGKHFQATEPKKLLDIEEERKRNIERLLPELDKMQSLQVPETVSAVFEGYEGFKTAFKKTIDECPIDGTINILGFSHQSYRTKSLRRFISIMNKKSIKKRQRLKILFDESVRNSLGNDREKEPYSEVRYMPEGYISPAAIDITEDYVFIFLWEEKPFVFMIKNEKIAESFKNYFRFLWSISKK